MRFYFAFLCFGRIYIAIDRGRNLTEQFFFLINNRLLKNRFQILDEWLTESPGLVGRLVCLGFNGPLRQYFSLYRAVSQREGERGKKR